VDLKDDDISTAHPIPRYDKSADEKIIVKFTRRDDRDEFYSNRKKVAGRKADSLKCLKDACATKDRRSQQENLHVRVIDSYEEEAVWFG